MGIASELTRHLPLGNLCDSRKTQTELLIPGSVGRKGDSRAKRISFLFWNLLHPRSFASPREGERKESSSRRRRRGGRRRAQRRSSSSVVPHRVSRTNATNPFRSAFSASPRYLVLMNTANAGRPAGIHGFGVTSRGRRKGRVMWALSKERRPLRILLGQAGNARVSYRL